MEQYQLFIAYHGTYDSDGSLRKAEELYQFLTANGVSCYLFSSVAQTNNAAFTNTPLIAANCQKFLLVCNENVKTDENGTITEFTSNGLYQEMTSFWNNRLYYNKSKRGDARVYCFGSFTTKMANLIHPMFVGVAHFAEYHNGGLPCFPDVLEWVTGRISEEKKTSLITDSLDDIRMASQSLSQKRENSVLTESFSAALLPKLAVEGGRTIGNIAQLNVEPLRNYVIHANGGAGKSSSLKYLWNQMLSERKWLPLYVSVRNCYEKYGQKEHPLFEYLIANYRLPVESPQDLPKMIRQADVNWLLLLDGFNEAENTDRISDDINLITDRFSIVMTTREKQFAAHLEFSNITYLNVLPLEEQVVRDYISGFGNNDNLKALMTDANMMVLLRNPMLLTMFCNSFDSTNYNSYLENKSQLTPGELIEKCVIAQLRKTSDVSLRSFFTTLRLFPMALADLFYSGGLANMSTGRMEISDAFSSVLNRIDLTNIQKYIIEYGRQWSFPLREYRSQYTELSDFLKQPDEFEIMMELDDFERIMSHVLQFFTIDDERSSVSGGEYRFDHQTYLNWYVSYGIYIMAALWPSRFTEIIQEITANVDLMSENTDDYEEQSEFIFDLIRDTCTEESYRRFASKLFNRHFARRTSRLYRIATDCISLFDKSGCSDEEYSNEVCSFCYSLFTLGKRGTPADMNEEDIVDRYYRKLESVIEKAQGIADEEYRKVTIAKINTIQGSYNLSKRNLYASAHRNDPNAEEIIQGYAREAERYQLLALNAREEVLNSGSGKYRDEMRNRITHSYTSLGTIRYYMKDFDKSIEYHQAAYQARWQLANDSTISEALRSDAEIRLPINLNRINGSTMAKGNVTDSVLEEMFDREMLVKDVKSEVEMINQVNNFTREIGYIGYNSALLEKARTVYEKISDNFNRLFGFESDALKKAKESLLFTENKISRIRQARESISSFINSEPFQQIVSIFNSGQPITDIEELNEFSANWDYRRKIAAGGERQAITSEDSFVAPHRETLIRCFRELGMIEEKTEELPHPDYVLPLGGFGSSNMRRCDLARRTCDRYQGLITVVALSSQRRIEQPAEFAEIKGFAPEAQTEYEEMDMAIKKAYGLTETISVQSQGTPLTRDHWMQCQYADSEDHRDYYNLSAPCYDEKRTRANTIDTFEHFLNCFKPARGSNVFLISTSLYEPYQYYSLLPAAIEYGVNLYFVGGEYLGYENQLLATLCLQDLKSAVTAMHGFITRYKDCQ